MIRPLPSKKSIRILAFAAALFAGASMAQETDSQNFEYVVGQENLDAVSNEPAHDHAAHAHAGDDHDHAGHNHAEHGEESHDDHVDHAHGTDGSIGGFLFPSMVVFGTFGAFEPGSNAEDFSTTEHDPLNEAGITAIEFDLGINIRDKITGLVAGFVYQDSNHDWRGEFEEGFLHYHVTPTFAFGGGQFLNTFGFQNSRHTHTWEFINQNLAQSRMLNEGHLTTQGGEVVIRTPANSGLLTLGGGGVRIHEGDHLHGGDEDEDEDEHGVDPDSANLDHHVFTGDYRFALPMISDAVMSLSYANGANASGGSNQVYGLGLQKIWNPVNLDPISLTPGVGAGSFMFRGEVLRRKANVLVVHEDEDEIESQRIWDSGVNAALHYGLSDQTTLSLRHDWVSEIEGAHGYRGADFHRTSTALSHFVDARRRGLLRFQYDHVRNDEIDSEHVGWMQLRLFFGGDNHEH